MYKLIILFLILAFNQKALAQSEWAKITPKDHNFELLFYQKPIEALDSTVFQGTSLYTYSWEADIEDTLHANKYYSIHKTTYPSDFIHSDSLFSVVEGFINSTQSSLLEDDAFTLLSSTLEEKNGFPGKVFKWKNIDTDMHLQFRIYLVNNILFQLSVVSREREEHNLAVNKYFDSFELVGLVKGSFEIISDKGKSTYSINFKDEPSMQHKVIDSEYGQLPMESRILETEDGIDPNLIYISTEVTYPNAFLDEGDVYALNNLYKNSINGSLEAVNGELISIDDIYYDSYLGKEYKCYYAGGKALMIFRVFYINGRLYQHGIITDPQKDNNKDMKKFFKSFKLLKNEK